MPPSFEPTTVANTGNFITKSNLQFISSYIGVFIGTLRGWQQVV